MSSEIIETEPENFSYVRNNFRDSAGYNHDSFGGPSKNPDFSTGLTSVIFILGSSLFGMKFVSYMLCCCYI